MNSLHTLIREAEQDYTSGEVTIGEYVSFDMHDTLERIDAYLNSKHVSGSTDSLGREKPFFNIVTAAVNIWYRATDIDRKNIKFLPPKLESTGETFLANIILQEWMRRENFGKFLNDWGRALARYGSAVVKFVEKEGRLIPSVTAWNRLIVDQIDFNSLPTIEVLYKTPAQLLNNKMYDQDVVKSLLDAKTNRETLDGQDKDEVSKFIKLYEIHGELEKSYLTDREEDDEVYVQQMHVLAFVKGDDEYQDFTLYRGREAKHPYLLTHLIEEDGRTLAIGAVEHLFEAQWMVNHTQKNVKDTLDLASKLIFQTSDERYLGRNVLTAIETGDIMMHRPNEPLTQINNSKADITAFMNFGQAWQALGSEITSTPDALRGNTMPASTPYSLGAYLGGQANSLFEIMTENKGLYLEEMMRKFVIDHLKKSMDTKDEIMALLDAEGIAEIDAMYIPREAKRQYNQQAKEMLINGDIPSPYQAEVAEGQVRSQLAELGNKRSFSPSDISDATWKKVIEGLEDRLIVEVTNEQADKSAVLQTLSTVLQTIASNPTILQDPNARLVFSQILTKTGEISPIQLSTTSTASTASVSPPQVAQQVPQITTGGVGEALPNNQ